MDMRATASSDPYLQIDTGYYALWSSSVRTLSAYQRTEPEAPSRSRPLVTRIPNSRSRPQAHPTRPAAAPLQTRKSRTQKSRATCQCDGLRLRKSEGGSPTASCARIPSGKPRSQRSRAHALQSVARADRAVAEGRNAAAARIARIARGGAPLAAIRGKKSADRPSAASIEP
eukprot:5403290-Prymnesium_polylepis.5